MLELEEIEIQGFHLHVQTLSCHEVTIGFYKDYDSNPPLNNCQSVENMLQAWPPYYDCVIGNKFLRGYSMPMASMEIMEQCDI
ncbi:hypothetical protein AQUCO_03800138v1 [Aquilegia coerulea]|uniref:Uncharacterized protein n=1 Tax=Aquilegia coerulea TaxID=218851 RepID=A0A2G5CSQ9_AQUCA|nr:hypothetical protein AQUCO_03800138v1 [Aquilegia coerulea]